MIKLGIIGYGGRGSGLVRMMERLPFDAKCVAIADVNAADVPRRMAAREKDPTGVRIYEQADAMLDKEKLNGVIVATRCSLHTEMAIKVMARGLPLYQEKPVATTMDDFRRLAAAARQAKSPVVVSFPLRVTQAALTARQLIASGQLGQITHVQGTNNVPYGEVYFQTWYRDERETGGLFLQKATHDIDVINCLLGEPEPVRVSAMFSKLVFHGDKPAGLRCVDCPEKLTCLESKFNPSASTGAANQDKADQYRCCFATDTGNEDSGDALIEYATGAKANYSQNFYSRRDAAVRRTRAIGHLGTVEVDFVNERTRLWIHHSSRSADYDCRSKGEGHGGGDNALAANFMQCILGKAESVSPLAAGLRSALICLLARESAKTNAVQTATKM